MATTIRDHMIDALFDAYMAEGAMCIKDILMHGFKGLDEMDNLEIHELYREVVLDGATPRKVWNEKKL
ncbi:MAG TPA: hypothetical protein EYQ21_05095 [Flavobacteriales bacterium]|nr:hypothetical protein [Flavobacteriales bacterium]